MGKKIDVKKRFFYHLAYSVFSVTLFLSMGTLFLKIGMEMNFASFVTTAFISAGMIALTAYRKSWR